MTLGDIVKNNISNNYKPKDDSKINMKSYFIVIEGPEGCGKSTQKDLVEEYLTSLGYNIQSGREPGGTPIGDKIRQLLLDPENKGMTSKTELFLFEASRAEFVEKKVSVALQKPNTIFLTDRFFDSTNAYQGYGRKLGPEAVNYMNLYAVGDIKAHLTVILDFDLEEGLSRAKAATGGKGDRLEQESLDFHKAVKEGYMNQKRLRPNENIHYADASGTREEVFNRIKPHIDALIKQ